MISFTRGSATMTKECRTCLYYGRPGSRKHDQGYCRINPPTLVVREKQLDEYGCWPLVDATDWCGKWAPSGGK